VYGIVKQSGGYIFASPGIGGLGTVFSVYLPAVPRAAMADPPPLATVVEAPAAASPSDIRLLLVEDDPAVRGILERGLRRHWPQVTAAPDAGVALDILAQGGDFDVLVSDIMMPGIDGVELAAQALAMQPLLGIVLMSGFAEPPLHRAVNARGVRFLSKPFALADLLSAVIGAATDSAEKRSGQPGRDGGSN
jgi:two-component system cell cycle sensor histidine kinase/response regulator CckA